MAAFKCTINCELSLLVPKLCEELECPFSWTVPFQKMVFKQVSNIFARKMSEKRARILNPSFK